MKKVLTIILFVLILGLGAGGTIYFYIQNKNQITANEQLAQQNAQVQAQLNAIGAMVNVYEVNKKVYSGNEILEGDLIEVSVPASTLADSSVTDKSLLVGKHYRVDIQQGTILSLDMLMDEDTDGTVAKFPYELTLTSLPVSTVVGDYVDLRLLLANGEELIVLNHMQIKRIYNTTITFNVSEEENALLISMFHDLSTYSNGCIAYVTKYLEPGNNDTISFYPVQRDMENYIRFNPNIEDATRCINETFRDHIDEVLLIYTDSKNTSVASSFISQMKTQLSGQLSAQNSWTSEHTDENGNIISDEGTVTSSSTSSSASLDQQTGEAMDSLESEISDLEEIQ